MGKFKLYLNCNVLCSGNPYMYQQFNLGSDMIDPYNRLMTIMK